MSDTKPTIVKVPAFAVVLTRGGKRTEMVAGKAAKFTKAEIDELAEIDENALRDPSEEAAALLSLQGGSTEEDGDHGSDGDDGDAEAAAQAKADAAAAAKAKAKAKSKTDDDSGL